MRSTLVLLVVVLFTVPHAGAEFCDADETEFNGFCYYRSETEFSWSDARKSCQDRGGDLVAITDQATSDFIKTLENDQSATKVWIGLNDIDVEGQFEWADGQKYEFTNWDYLEPNNKGEEDCVEIKLEINRWNDRSCYAEEHYICQRKAETTDDFLLYNYVEDIRRYFINSGQHESLDVGVKLDFVYSVEYDWIDSSVYWSDLDQHKIYKYSLDTGILTVIADEEVSDVEGLALDWSTKNLYWVNAGMKRIETARDDGKFRRVLIDGILDKPRGIALDPYNGKMYWNDWGAKPCITRADMDGVNAVAIVDTDIYSPMGVTIDHDAQTLYWTEAYYDRIEMADLDGANRKVLLSEDLSHPHSIAVYKNDVYWNDLLKGTIMKANKVTGEARMTVLSYSKLPVDLKIAAPPKAKAIERDSKDSRSRLGKLVATGQRGGNQ